MPRISTPVDPPPRVHAAEGEESHGRSDALLGSGSSELLLATYGPIAGANVLESTVARIVQTIRLGLVEPGQAMPSERELAARFAISRDTVREALRVLADQGWVVRRRGRAGGTFAAEIRPAAEEQPAISRHELEDLLDLRLVLESGAARLAASRTLAQECRAELWARHQAVSASTAPDYLRLDTRLHLTIAEIAGVPSLVRLIAENRARINALFMAVSPQERRLEHSNHQHERVLSAILAGHPDEADAAIREHLEDSAARLRQYAF